MEVRVNVTLNKNDIQGRHDTAEFSSPGIIGADAAGQRGVDFCRAGKRYAAQIRNIPPAEQRFWYFTGFNEPEALLVLIKSDERTIIACCLTAFAI